jgi:hypothetical protein
MKLILNLHAEDLDDQVESLVEAGLARVEAQEHVAAFLQSAVEQDRANADLLDTMFNFNALGSVGAIIEKRDDKLFLAILTGLRKLRELLRKDPQRKAARKARKAKRKKARKARRTARND